jgi:amino acid permease
MFYLAWGVFAFFVGFVLTVVVRELINDRMARVFALGVVAVLISVSSFMWALVYLASHYFGTGQL